MLGYLDDEAGDRRGDRRRRLAAHRRRRHPRRRTATSRSPTGSRTCTSPAASTSTPPRSSRRSPRLDGVADVAVVGVPDDRLGEVGKAYVVVSTGSTDVPTPTTSSRSPRSGSRTSRCRGTSSCVDALPRNLSGKVLKTELRGGFETGARAPSSTTERSVVEEVAQQPSRNRPRRRQQLMDLTLSESELAFQAEARAWLEANVPAEPLPSMDTEEGFAAHRAWEAKLAEARWSVVSWPEEYGGRGASLVEWVIFEEEYYRAGAPGRVSQNGIFLLAPIVFDHGTQEQQDRFLPSMAHRRAGLGAGLVRARGRVRPGVAAVDRPARRGPRRMGAQRPEDLVVAGDVRALGLRAVPLRPGGAAARRADLLPVPAGRRRASPSARSPSSTARRASPRSSSRTCSCPTPTCSAPPATAGGWR